MTLLSVFNFTCAGAEGPRGLHYIHPEEKTLLAQYSHQLVLPAAHLHLCREYEERESDHFSETLEGLKELKSPINLERHIGLE